MRLFLLPISTRRTLIYAQRLEIITPEQQSWLDKGTKIAAKVWAKWEKKESGWQKKVVDYGNQAMKRIPYEEWGLKSIPPLSAKVQKEQLARKEKIEVSFPTTLIPEENVLEVLRKLGTERQNFHRSTMIWCFVGMPVTAPVALIPVIPNIPFFYLVFRAWSHWRALSGSKHVEFLLDKNLLTLKPSKILDELYSTGQQPFAPEPASNTKEAVFSNVDEERMVLHASSGGRIAEALTIPDLNIELGRAVSQVEKALHKEKELQEEKMDLDASASEAKKKE